MRWIVVLGCCCLLAAAWAGDLVVSTPDALVFGGVAMAPARPLAELLGATISVQDKTLTLTRQGKTFTCTPDQTTAQVNGQEITLPLAPFVRVGVAYVPLRAGVTALNGSVVEDRFAGTITVAMPGVADYLYFPWKSQPGDPAAYHDYDRELYVVNLDGTGLRRLTYDTEDIPSCALSPDGSMIAMDIGGVLMVRRLDAPAVMKLTARITEGTYFAPHDFLAFSPDGHDVLFSREEGIWLADLKGVKGMRKLAEGSWPCFSPDGKYILYQDRRDGRYDVISLMERDGGHRREIARGYWPFFSRDGKTLYWRIKEHPEYSIFSLVGCPIDLSGKLGDARIAINDIDTTDVALHPDGTQYLYTEYRGKAGDPLGEVCIMTRKIDGTNKRCLTSGALDGNPHYTPDGTAIVFSRLNQRGNDDIHDIWIMRDGSDPRRIITGMHESVYEYYVYPGDFSPDGKRLFFTASPERVE